MRSASNLCFGPVSFEVKSSLDFGTDNDKIMNSSESVKSFEVKDVKQYISPLAGAGVDFDACSAFALASASAFALASASAFSLAAASALDLASASAYTQKDDK